MCLGRVSGRWGEGEGGIPTAALLRLADFLLILMMEGGVR